MQIISEQTSELHTHAYTHIHIHTCTHMHIYKHVSAKTQIQIPWAKEFISLPSFSVVEEGKADVLVLGSTLDDKVDAVTGITIERDGTDGLVDGTDDRGNDDDGDVSDDGDDGNDAGGVGRSSVAIIEHMLIK